MIQVVLYTLLMWGVAVYAFYRGGWEERLCSAAFVTGSYASLLLRSPHGSAFRHLEFQVMLVDSSFFLLMAIIASLSKKYWPMWVTAMTALTLLEHFLPYMPHMDPDVYFLATIAWSYPMWIIIAIGVQRHSLTRSR